jgi:hypothetical protein
LAPSAERSVCWWGPVSRSGEKDTWESVLDSSGSQRLRRACAVRSAARPRSRCRAARSILVAWSDTR